MLAILWALMLPGVKAEVPQLINYQGRVVVGTTNFGGTGEFKFALINGADGTTLWRNHGTGAGEPANAVAITVSNGLYSVLLGDTSLTNMAAIPNSAFDNGDVRLRVWINDDVNGSQQVPRGLAKTRHAGPADNLQIRDPWPGCGHNLVVHAVGEEGVPYSRSNFQNGRTAILFSGAVESVASSNCWNSGLWRIGSHTGSSLRRCGDTNVPAGMVSNRRSVLIASCGSPTRAWISANPSSKLGPQ